MFEFDREIDNSASHSIFDIRLLLYILDWNFCYPFFIWSFWVENVHGYLKIKNLTAIFSKISFLAFRRTLPNRFTVPAFALYIAKSHFNTMLACSCSYVWLILRVCHCMTLLHIEILNVSFASGVAVPLASFNYFRIRKWKVKDQLISLTFFKIQLDPAFIRYLFF